MTCTTGSDPGLTILPSSPRDQVNISHSSSEHWINSLLSCVLANVWGRIIECLPTECVCRHVIRLKAMKLLCYSYLWLSLICVLTRFVFWMLCLFVCLSLTFFHTNSFTVGETSVCWLFRFYARPTQPTCRQVPPSLSSTPVIFTCDFLTSGLFVFCLFLLFLNLHVHFFPPAGAFLE